MNKNFAAVIFGALSLALGFLGMKLIFLPAGNPQNNYSTAATANIATSISGILSPVFGLLSTILLYLTLSKQADSIKEQKVQNGSDAIVASIQLCQKAIDDFSYRYTQGQGAQKVNHNIKGGEGLFEFTNLFCYASNAIWHTSTDTTYEESPEAKQISWIISTYEIAFERIKVAQMPDGIKAIFQKAIKEFYETQLSYSVRSFSTMFYVHPNLKDDEALKIISFYSKMENKEWDEKLYTVISNLRS